MSFPASNNVNGHHRHQSDASWGSAGQNAYTKSNIGAKLDGYFDKKELPMYKDKPYNYASSRRKPWYRKWRFTFAVILSLVGLLSWIGLLSSPTDAAVKAKGTSKSTWSWMNKPGAAKVDWDDRREKVKEAFMRSWDGYEKYAWGGFTPRRIDGNEALRHLDVKHQASRLARIGRLIIDQGTINTILFPRKALR